METVHSNHKMGSPSFLNTHRKVLRLLMVASGICCSYWLYGFLQEKLITKSRLGATFVLVIQTLTNMFVATVWQNIETKKTTTTRTTNTNAMKLNHPLLFLTSACYVFAMTCSNESLRFVPYPVAVLAKSCKLIPTMVMGSLIERRQYSFQQWSAAICISAGIALFNYSRIPHTEGKDVSSSSLSTSSSSSDEDYLYLKGMVLLFISLGMDGFLGACQGTTPHQRIDCIGRCMIAYRFPSALTLFSIYSLSFLCALSERTAKTTGFENAAAATNCRRNDALDQRVFPFLADSLGLYYRSDRGRHQTPER